MKAREAVVAWTEADEPDESPFAVTRGQVHVGLMGGEGDWTSKYMNSNGGAHREGSGSPLDTGFVMIMMMSDFRSVVMAGVDPKAADQAFCAIDEWVQYFHPERVRYPGVDETADDLERVCANEE